MAKDEEVSWRTANVPGMRARRSVDINDFIDGAMMCGRRMRCGVDGF